MDTEDMKSAIALLEEVINSNMLTMSKTQLKQFGGKKINTSSSSNKSSSNVLSSRTSDKSSSNVLSSVSQSNTSQSSSSSSHSNITGDSLTIGEIGVPSEMFVTYSGGNSDNFTMSSHNSVINLADSNKYKMSENDYAEIINVFNEKLNNDD